MPRPDLASWMMEQARNAAKRSTCLSRSCGCVIARGNQPLLMGYNGAASGELHCSEVGCSRKDSLPGEDLDRCRGLHAEMGAITIAAKYGIALEGTTMWITHEPCGMCWPRIANAGIIAVYFELKYPHSFATEIPRSIRVERLAR